MKIGQPQGCPICFLLKKAVKSGYYVISVSKVLVVLGIIGL